MSCHEACRSASRCGTSASNLRISGFGNLPVARAGLGHGGEEEQNREGGYENHEEIALVWQALGNGTERESRVCLGRDTQSPGGSQRAFRWHYFATDRREC